MYDDAPHGEKTIMIPLFGIKHYKAIKECGGVSYEAFVLEQISVMSGLRVGLDAGFAFSRIAANGIGAWECGVFTGTIIKQKHEYSWRTLSFPPPLPGLGYKNHRNTRKHPKACKNRLSRVIFWDKGNFQGSKMTAISSAFS